MPDMNMTLTTNDAFLAAVKGANLKSDAVRCTYINFEDGLYEFSFQTDFQLYDIYVDAKTGDVLGLSTEPYFDYDLLFGGIHEEAKAA